MAYLVFAVLTAVVSFGLIIHSIVVILKSKPNLTATGLVFAMALLMMGATSPLLNSTTPYSVITAVGFLLALFYADLAVAKLQRG